jgi:release factor glutamine methyltransferase
MTPRELLQQVDIDRSEAELLLAGLLEVDRGWLIAHADEALDEQRVDLFLTHANARASGEPLAYVLGYRDFWTLRLAVNQHVLIPRRETEHLVEWAIECIDAGAHTALDLGTGSGAIALACKSERPATQVTGVDLSSEALLCARKNSRSLDLDVDWRLGDWFQAVPGMRWDVVMSNPPYIAADDVHLNRGDLPAEPDTALVGGETGLEAIEQIVKQAPEALNTAGWLLIEHGYDQAEPVMGLLRSSGFKCVETRQDWSHQARVTGGQWLN